MLVLVCMCLHSSARCSSFTRGSFPAQRGRVGLAVLQTALETVGRRLLGKGTSKAVVSPVALIPMQGLGLVSISMFKNVNPLPDL